MRMHVSHRETLSNCYLKGKFPKRVKRKYIQYEEKLICKRNLLGKVQRRSYTRNLPAVGELSARVFLARSNEMTNKKYQRGIPKPKQKQHTGSPAISI